MTKSRYYVCDFETTTYEGIERTDVWASACVELFASDDSVLIFGSIWEQLDYFIHLNCKLVVYFHNLKFDGHFIMDYLLKNGYYNALDENEKFLSVKELKNNQIITSISEQGQWYKIVMKKGGNTIEFRDSLKLLPFSLEKIGKDFKTKHQKLNMNYIGFRYPNCPRTSQEDEYIKNDVLVIKEALEIMFNDGHTKLTIGSCCLEEYKRIIKKEIIPEFYEMFPDLTKRTIPDYIDAKHADEYVRRSYAGGWCYLNPTYKDVVVKGGCTFDVNSLYPYVMRDCAYPVGNPIFFKGRGKERKEDLYYFYRFSCEFHIKEGYLPFIHIRNSLYYKANENLTTSDITLYGITKPNLVTMTMTETDLDLFLEHYNVTNFTFLDGCYFRKEYNIFTKYIDKYAEIKMNSTGAVREESKLFLNNLYGKMATSDDSSYKICYLDSGVINYKTIAERDKKTVFIPVGSAITSYARNITIRAAQKNYKNGYGFIYADTDSIHCALKPDEVIGIETHDTIFGKWKLESEWEIGLFVRQKTYLEVINGFIDIKCAGMTQKCKDIFRKMVDIDCEIKTKLTGDEIEYCKRRNCNITEFREGLELRGKLKPKRIDGGIILEETTFCIK